jgi:Protein of unknown function (DUF4232)
MSDLQHLLERFAEEGEQRGATAVLDAAATIVASRRKRRHFRRMAATLVALTIAIGGTAVSVRSGNHERGLVVTAATPVPTDSLAPIPAPEKPREQIQVALDRASAPLAVGNGRIWVGGTSGVEAFDPLTLHRVGTVATVLPVLELASSSNGLWVLSGRDFNLDAQRNPRYRLERVDPSTLKVQLAMDLPFAVGYHSSWHIRLAAASETVWVALGSSVLRIDSRSSTAMQVGPTGQSVGNIAADSSGLWIIADNAPLLQHIDTATNTVTTIRGLPDGFYWSIAATTDAAWLIASVDAGPGLRLIKVDAASHAIATYRIPGVALVGDNGQLWVQVIDPHGHSLNFDNLVAQIDTRNGRLLRTVKISIGEEPGSSGNGYASLPFVVTGDKIWSAYNGLQRTTLDRKTTSTTISASSAALSCHATQLRVTMGSGGGATGHLGQDFVLRNASDATCSLRGAVTVHQYDQRGRLLSGRSVQGDSFMFPAVPARLIVVRSGGYASFATEVGDVNTDGLSYSVQCPTPARTDFVLPNGGGVLRSPRFLGGCNYSGITVTVSNIVAGPKPPTY